MLIRNLMREVLSTLPRLMSVIIVTALGVFMYVGMSGINYNLGLIVDSYYSEQNVADYWIYGQNLTKEDAKKISKIDGVSAVQPRVVLDAQPVREKDVTVTLHAVSGGFDINRPYLIKGRLPESAREFMLYDDYAKKHGIDVGDTYELKLKDIEGKITMTVSGLMKSVEYIYNVSGIDLIPDSYKLGFAYMHEESLKDIMGENRYNQILVTLSDGVDEQQFKNDLDKEMGNKISALMSFEDNKRSSMLKDAIKEIKSVTVSLPVLFFLISALIMFTTMSRIIEGARTQTGVIKALGYRDSSIFIYYLAYAEAVVILGVLLGALPSLVMTNLFMNMYRDMMSIPIFVTKMSMGSLLEAFIITNIFCTGTSVYVCIKELREMPAECIRPKMPKRVRKNFIEKITFLWKKMTFTEKTITRNIFRNKMRLVMCVVGVAGCMAVIVTAFGMKDSNNRFFSMLFDKLHRYDLQVILKHDVTDAQYKRIAGAEGIQKIEYQMGLAATMEYDGKKESDNITVVEDVISLMLLDINSESIMEMPRNGAVVSSILAKKLDLKKGDMLFVHIAGINQTIAVEVDSVMTNINGIYIGRSLWRALGREYLPTSIYINSSNPRQTAEEISSYEFVLSVMQKSEVVESIEVQLETMNTMVFVLTLFGGVLALVVLYNLGIMNYFERMRELATLMVLGFFDKEIRVLVLRENSIFTVAGIVLGMPLGIWLHTYLMGSGESAGFEIDIYISVLTFFIAAGLTYLFSIFVNFMLGKKFKQIDMIGALKSVE